MAEKKPTEKEKWDERKKRIERIDAERIKRLDEEAEKHSSLSDKIIRTLKSWVEKILDVVSEPFSWALSFGVEKILDIIGERSAKLMKPAIDKMRETGEVSPELEPLLKELETPTGEIAGLLGQSATGVLVGGAFGKLIDAMFLPIAYQAMRIFKPTIPAPQDLIRMRQRGELGDEAYHGNMAAHGFEGEAADLLLEIARPLLYPDTLATLFHRFGWSEEVYIDLMGKLGWDRNEAKLYLDQTYLYPGQTDLVRMAVREVFTPEVVEKFGQMEDFPPAFAEECSKIGLSEEWARNYWAAHWDLPSTTQAFEMYHRGVIDEAELTMLLRALDIMPFWRDKLTQIAFRPFTRVDVRRMHKVGTLDDAAVKRAYLDLGYDEEKAQAMTDFTIAYNTKTEEIPESEEIDWTRTEIVDAFRRGVMSEAEARDLLKELDYSEERIDFYIKREELKREQNLKGEYLKRYRTLYVEGMIGWSDVSEGLLIKGFVATELEPLQEVWDLEKQYRVAHPSRADLDRFLKNDVIDDVIYRREMRNMGYTDQYIDWYLAAIAAAAEE